MSCLPVVVLGMGSALAHLLRSDVATMRAAAIKSDRSCAPEPAQSWTSPSSADLESQDRWRVDSSADVTISGHSGASGLIEVSPEDRGERPPLDNAHDGRARPPARVRHNDAQAVASELIASGQRDLPPIVAIRGPTWLERRSRDARTSLRIASPG